MNRLWLNLMVVFGVLILVGIIKAPLEIKMEREMREDNLLPPKIELSDRNKIGQAGYAAALGGFRDVLASYYYLKAHNLQADKNWFEMERTLNTVVTLQPRSEHLWDMAGFHLAYNAGSSEKRNVLISPAERSSRSTKYYDKGDEFYQRGLEQLPESYKLGMARVRLQKDHFRIPDYNKALFAVRDLLKNGEFGIDQDLQAWAQFSYILASLPSKEAEAYAEMRKLYQYSPPKKRVPTLRVALYILQEKLMFRPEEKISENLLLFDPAMYKEFTSIYSFETKCINSSRQALEEVYADYLAIWNKAVSRDRIDVLRAKISFLQEFLDIEKEKRVPDSQLFRDEENKAYVKGMLGYRKKVEAMEANPFKAMQELVEKVESGTATRADKDLLILALNIYPNHQGKLKLTNPETLATSNEMKYKQLYTFWETRNNMSKRILREGITNMEILVTGNVVRILQKYEDLLKVPFEDRIQPSDVFTGRPF